MRRKSARRHESLIPLSREHQYALLLCLRIRRALAVRNLDIESLRVRAAKAAQFFDEDLRPHFHAEEQVLFPAMSKLSGAAEIIEELLVEHRRLEALASSLLTEESSPAHALTELADKLDAHIRKEERVLFPIYEQYASAETKSFVEEHILALIGTAAHPKHPELLD